MRSIPRSLILFCLLFLCTLSLTGQEHKRKIGVADPAWFEENPFAGDTSVHAYVIYHKREDLVNPELYDWPAVQMRSHLLMKIQDEQGFKYATFTFTVPCPKGEEGYNRIAEIEGYTHNSIRGVIQTTKLLPELIHKERIDPYYITYSFSLPRVMPGSVIEIYKKELNTYLDDIPPYYFEFNFPVIERNYEFQSPVGWNYKPIQFGTGELEIKMTPDSTMSKWKRNTYSHQTITFTGRNFKPIVYEDYVSSMRNYITSVEMVLASRMTSKNAVYKYWWDWGIFADHIQKSPALAEVFGKNRELEKWAKEYKGPADLESKCRWVLDQIHQKVRWNEHYSYYMGRTLKQILDNGSVPSSDMNLLAIGLLRALGEPAQAIFIATRELGYFSEKHPSDLRLNSMITGIGTEKGDIQILDASAPESGLNVVPVNIINNTGLMVGRNWSRLVKMNGYSNYQLSVNANLELDTLGILTGEMEFILKDYAALPFARYSSGDPVLRFEKSILEGYELSDYATERKDNYTWVVRARAKSILPATDLGTSLAVALLPKVEGAVPEFQKESRRYPIEFPYATIVSKNFKIKLPPGYTLRGEHEPVHIQTANKAIDYRYAIKNDSGIITINSNFINRQLYYPVADYPMLKSTFELIHKKQSALYEILKQGAPVGAD